MMRNIPNVTKDLGFDFWWDTKKLMSEKAPVEKMSVKDFEWMFHLPFWTENGEEVVLKPIEVAESPLKYQEQYKRTMETDLSYPVTAMYLNNKWVIMDGLHRALKAYIQKDKTIKVKKFHREDIPRIRV